MSGKRVSAELRRKMEARQRELFDSYVASILGGTRRAGLAEIKKVERHISDLERARDGWDWTFNWKAAHKVLCWMQSNLRFPSGSVAESALKLEPWQVFDIATLFGWVSVKNQWVRRFTTGYWQVARKNGKPNHGRSQKRVDLVIAGIMSYDLARRQWGEAVEDVAGAVLFF
jgi:phage terminase large subunit-like protein